MDEARVRTKVFLDELWWDLRSRNMDWRYVRFLLPRLSEYEPQLDFVAQRSRAVTVRGNTQTIRDALGRRIGRPPTEQDLLTSRLDAGELKRSGADLVFAHRAFPLNVGMTPVVWQSAILDPAMQRSYGVTEAALEEQITVKGQLFTRCAAVQLSTQAEVDRHDRMFPALAGRFFAVPFFTPDVHACSRDAVERHHSAEPVRLLFVGNHAVRKGLTELLEAFVALPAAVRARATLTVLSNFDRSPMVLPTDERITVRRGVPYAGVMAEMARSHVFVNVARFESYGLVFHEAMSQGLACIGPDWEVQRELLDDGNAGVSLPCTPAAIGPVLQRLIEDEEYRYRLGVAAWERFQRHYAAPVVAARYARLFERVRGG